ncbi:hypothetical protein T484DRAFT_2387970 [Baffinella frigidus]|nr:hypothetical protein T484DRAFT_2387970 [Cryptophyta sp. CCMP2293]
MGMYIAVGIDDHSLACRSAVQVYNLLLPLLRKKMQHEFLLDALLVARQALRVLLKAVRNNEAPAHGNSALDPEVRRTVCCISRAVSGILEQLRMPDLLVRFLEDELDELAFVLARVPVEEGEEGEEGEALAMAPSVLEEEQALWEGLLSLNVLRSKTSEISADLRSTAVDVLPLLKGNPQAAKDKIPAEDPRFLNFTLRVVEQAVAERSSANVEEWVAEAMEKCREQRLAVITTQPPQPKKMPLPSIDPPPEEEAEEKTDAAEEKADKAALHDLEIQYLTPSEEQVEEWEEKKVARVERVEIRKANQTERIEARRVEAVERLRQNLLGAVRLNRERRKQRGVVKSHQNWLAALTMVAGSNTYDQAMSIDLNDEEQWPEDIPIIEEIPPEPPAPLEEGEEAPPEEEPELDEEGNPMKKRTYVPKKAISTNDPAYIRAPETPGPKRLPMIALKNLTQAVTLASRVGQWAVLLNASVQAANLVRDMFAGEASTLALAAPMMRRVADSILGMLTEIKCVCEGRPSPTATPAERNTFVAPPTVAVFSLAAGLVHRIRDGNREAHDKYDTGAVSRTMVLAMEALVASKRWLAILCLGYDLRKLANPLEDMAFIEAILPMMIKALEEINKENAVSVAAKKELAALTVVVVAHEKEVLPNGRLREGLRARLKEREAMLAEIDALKVKMAVEETIMKRLRFRAMSTLPGRDQKLDEMYQEWLMIKKVIGRDKSLCLQDLQRCRGLLVSFQSKDKKAAHSQLQEDAAAALAKQAAEDKAAEDAENAEEGADANADAPPEGPPAGEGAEEEGGGVKGEMAVVVGSEVARGGERKAEAEGIALQYARCVAMLREKREKELLAPALLEYGEVLWYLGNKKGAGAVWNDALDSVFTVLNMGRNWRDTLDPSLLLDPPARAPTNHNLLERIGVVQLLRAGALAARLAQRTYHQDLHLQLEYALLAAHLFAQPFTSGLPHPQRARDFATYTPRELLPGGNVFADPTEADPVAVLDACAFVARVLLKNGHALETLPMLSLAQFVASQVSKDAVAMASASAYKARACAQCNLIGDAVVLVLDVHHGRNLPDILPLNRPPVGQSGLQNPVTVAYHDAAAPSDAANQEALQAVATLELVPGLLALFPPAVQLLLRMARIEILLAPCSQADEWPHPDPALQETCATVQELIEALRSEIVDTATTIVEKAEGEEEGGEEGAEAVAPGYTRLALATVAECDLLLAAMQLKRWETTKSIETLDALAALFTQQSETLSGPAAIKAFKEPSDARHHTDSHQWLQARLLRAEALFQQGRWEAMKAECSRAMSEMATLNEQMLSREIMTLQVMADVATGKTDLALDSLMQIVAHARRLGHADTRVVYSLGSLAVLQRLNGSNAAHGSASARDLLAEANTSLREAQDVLEARLRSLGLPQSKCRYLSQVPPLINIKVHLASIAQQMGGWDALEESVVLCDQAEVLLDHALVTPNHARASLHLLRARARRQLFEERFATLAWGGDLKPGEGAAVEGGAVEGAGAGAFSAQEAEYNMIMSDLEKGMAALANDGGLDLQTARCLALESALLHGAGLVPGKQAAHLRISMTNLRQAAELLKRRRALVMSAAQIPAKDAEVKAKDPKAKNAVQEPSVVPYFASTELLEAAVEQSNWVSRSKAKAAAAAAARDERSGGKGAGVATLAENDEEPPTAPDLSLRSLVCMLLALLRERGTLLFRDGPASARIAALHKAIAKAFPVFAEACQMHLVPADLRSAEAPTAHRVVAQWYRPRDPEGAGEEAARLIVALAPGGLAGAGEEGGVGALLCERSLDAEEGTTVELGRIGDEVSRLMWLRNEVANPQGAATKDWSSKVFPTVGKMQLQGAAAEEAHNLWFSDAALKANVSAMKLLGVISLADVSKLSMSTVSSRTASVQSTGELLAELASKLPQVRPSTLDYPVLSRVHAQPLALKTAAQQAAPGASHHADTCARERRTRAWRMHQGVSAESRSCPTTRNH